LDQLADGWPEAIRKEIEAWALAQAVVELPVNELAGGMKSGKLTFTWKQLTGWIKPAPPRGGASALAASSLELPLRIIAPLFMKTVAPARPQRKAAVDQNIPDLFGSDVMPKPAEPVPAETAPAPAAAPELAPARPAEPAPRPVAAPQPVAAPARAAAVSAPAPAPAPVVAAPILPAQLPVGPGEVVKFVASMAGMQGAVVALQDGLLIAGQLPPPLQGETIAAFLPQMFGRMSQYTVELNAGELSQLTFKAGSATWAVFKSHEVYFAAVGAPDKPLPLAELSILAEQAGRQN
jgi:predicted regulator of Ras-like GTPase activity (Roadblock/LC7/MglB family)